MIFISVSPFHLHQGETVEHLDQYLQETIDWMRTNTLSMNPENFLAFKNNLHHGVQYIVADFIPDTVWPSKL